MARSRSPSTDSTLSCIELDATLEEAPDSTPPTSVGDAGSVSSKSFLKDDDLATVGRSKRPRVSVVNYNESALAGKQPNRKRQSMITDFIGADTSFGTEAREMVEESIEVLNMGWSIDSLPLNHLPNTATSKKSLLKKATSAVSRTGSVLGKRGRDAVDAGLGRVQVMGKRASLRVMQLAEKGAEPPVEEKIKVIEEVKTIEVTTTATPRKPVKAPTTKRWLTQGLYVGQDPDFDPRMTEAKNKLKKASKGPTKHRTILPKPMFGGKRLIEVGRPFQLPWDVFNPLPPGQPKPDEWRKVQKNTFSGDSADYWRHTKLTEMSKCLCTPETGCDEDCLNRTMFYECDSSNCNVGVAYCKNRSFENLRKRVKAGGKYNIGVEVVKTREKGYGVRSNRTFEPDQIIVEYTGEIITPEECDRRMYTEYKDNEVRPCLVRWTTDTDFLVLLPNGVRPEYDHRRYSRLDRAVRQPLLRTKLQNG